MRRLALVALGLAGLVPAAHAFQPESGVWFNPAESGRGMTLEIQDNILIFSGYLYEADGDPIWYTSAGPLSYTYNSQGVLQTVTYTGQLDAYRNGQCLGCPYRAPTVVSNAGGPISINFRTEVQANLTWGGVTIPIERFSGAVGTPVQRMRGEWQAVIDFFDRGNTSEWPYASYPFFGEVLLFNRLSGSGSSTQALGCRPPNTETRCTTAALRDHDIAAQLNSSQNAMVITVRDIPGTFSSAATFFAYFVNLGVDQFDGVVSIYRDGGVPTRGPFYPVRGFRSASRTYAETGVGPASADDGKALDSRNVPGISAMLAGEDGSLPPGLTLAEATARTGLDIKVLARDVPGLVASMDARAAARDQP
jgi:hypothetical protein